MIYPESAYSKAVHETLRYKGKKMEITDDMVERATEYINLVLDEVAKKFPAC